MLAKVKETPAMAGEVLREASRIGNKVAGAVKDGVRGANQQIKDGVRMTNEQIQRGRHAAEEMLDDARLRVKRKPLKAVAVVFAAGLLSGGVIAHAAMRRS